jgi:hypothetical protein
MATRRTRRTPRATASDNAQHAEPASTTPQKFWATLSVRSSITLTTMANARMCEKMLGQLEQRCYWSKVETNCLAWQSNNPTDALYALDNRAQAEMMRVMSGMHDLLQFSSLMQHALGAGAGATEVDALKKFCETFSCSNVSERYSSSLVRAGVVAYGLWIDVDSLRQLEAYAENQNAWSKPFVTLMRMMRDGQLSHHCWRTAKVVLMLSVCSRLKPCAVRLHKVFPEGQEPEALAAQCPNPMCGNMDARFLAHETYHKSTMFPVGQYKDNTFHVKLRCGCCQTAFSFQVGSTRLNVRVVPRSFLTGTLGIPDAAVTDMEDLLLRLSVPFWC